MRAKVRSGGKEEGHEMSLDFEDKNPRWSEQQLLRVSSCETGYDAVELVCHSESSEASSSSRGI